jgi:peptidoglycan-N-acetylglucosamine deacetylase
MRRLTPPRLVIAVIVAAFLVSLASTDVVAAGIAVAGGLAVTIVLRRRSRSASRTALFVVIAAATGVAVLAALTLPTYHARMNPLVLTSAAPRATTGTVPALGAAPPGGFTALGFVASDYDDSGAGVDRDVASLSTLAATGITLAPSPGSIVVHPAGDVLVRAHIDGAAGLAVVSNYNGTVFDGTRAATMLQSPQSRHRFISALTGEMARRGWDGVVLDLEQLPPSARSDYPELVHELGAAAGNRQVVVAVPATSAADDGTGAYDLHALGAAAGAVVWMAYDQHGLASGPGPVAGLPWVRETLATAEAAIPRAKLLLGIPGYGYAWPPSGAPTDLTAGAAHDLAATPGATARWDDSEQEWEVRTADGRTVWYEDARSFGVRARLAESDGLGGVALWRVGAEDPGALAQLPVPVLKHPATDKGRPIERVQAPGVVALTFDDGPDPQWTPRILDILRRNHVPATFFVIGIEAQKYPALLRAEAAEGNVVGNHTYSHQNLENLPGWRAETEMVGGAAVIESIIGSKPVLFRPPYGAGDRKGSDPGADALAARLHDHVVDWNDDPNDWTRPGTAEITKRVLDGATSRTVVLLHDGGGNRSQTVDALPDIIAGFRDRGFLFTTVDGLDASIGSPYADRKSAASQARGLAVVAAFRLEMALRRMALYLLLAIAGLSILRIVVSTPLALAQARRRRRPLPAPPPGLRFSIVVPAHDEARVIAKSLAAIGRLGGDGVEVIVVDDGSTDGTADIARTFPCRVIRQRQQGKAAALNTGIAVATGDVVVVLDADTVLAPDFLARIAPHFADPAVGAVAGNVKVGNRRSFLARLQALEYIVSLNLDRRAQAQLNVMSVVPGAAGAFRRRALIDVGGYPTDTLVEDADLTFTLLAAGWRIPYEPAAVAWTEAPQRVSAVMRQRRRWSYGTVEVVAKHAGSLFDTGTGRVGLVGLPWTLLTQVLLPLGGPLADAFLLYLAAVGDIGMALVILGLAAALETAMIAVAVLVEKEDRRLLVWAPFLRLVWRPLQLLAVFRSVRSWAHGDAEGWRAIERYNTVDVPGPALPEPQAGDRVGVGLGEPDRPVGTGRQPFELPVAAPDAVLRHPTGERDPAELVRPEIGEPQAPVAGGHDVLGGAVLGHRELLDRPGGRDPADPGRAVLGEPQVPVRGGGDALGSAVLRRQGELGERTARGQPADLG